MSVNRVSVRSIIAVLMVVGCATDSARAEGRSLDRTAALWAPYIEWSLPNPTFDGNAFDVIATATFVHEQTGQKRTTGMFYDGKDSWRFRFTGTRIGKWTFTTSSVDRDLDQRRGSVLIKPNSNSAITGFITNHGNKWARPASPSRELRAFVPQLVMYAAPKYFHNKPHKIDADIKKFFVEHGFNGFHVVGSCQWFDIDKLKSTDIHTPNPDRRTFEALELLITKAHSAGGMVHLWMWGDEARRWTPKRWGLGGAIDRRLQRYLAARLGPLPGWTIGYGFDLDEWVVEEDLGMWHKHLHQHLGWPHLLGARDAGPNHGLDHRKAQIYEGLDYSAYEHHRPTHQVYRAALNARRGKPAFSEDRFRIRQSKAYAGKDYNMERTRRGLWHSTMAGGVANIWGYLPRGRDSWLGSAPYEDPAPIKTYARFFNRRFLNDMTATSDITDGACLRVPAGTHYVFYKEDAGSIEMDLSKMAGGQGAIAVDTKKPYLELRLGRLAAEKQTWATPYDSDWAIAVGEFK
ncbi:MAG: DUF5060 domain-containing protein [Pirellulaceae bacterium]|nr:DUF5060 domain-containing protein [Pirellulaceae bacterium]